MEIRITDMNIEDAAGILEDLAFIAQDSARHGDLPSELYVSALELIGNLATAIKEEARRAA